MTLNESGSSSVTITSVTYDSNGLGIDNATNNWADSAAIAAAGTNLTGALTKLRSQAQAFGSSLSTVQIRQDFTKATINTLQTGADALTLADFERRRRELAGVADPPAVVDHRPVPRLAGEPGRAPPVRLIPKRAQRSETAVRKGRRFSLRAQGALTCAKFNQHRNGF